MWTLEQGLEIVRMLQPKTRQFSYHLAIGGGVVNNGSSEKDLDLYFLPLDNTDPPDPSGLRRWLDDLWGGSTNLDTYGESEHYKFKRKYYVGDQRIDVFIV